MPLLPDMIGITVRDMGRALTFYRLLDLVIASDPMQNSFAETITPNGYRISWNTVEVMKEMDPDWKEPTGHRMALAFKCDSPAEVDATYNTIVAAGYEGHKAPWDAVWGQRYAVVVDPDGNLVDLFAALT
ncbi:MAG: VOC family protein [Cytophagales bacterium]|nr:VOC family protein [Armatimonadota bacterium]